MLKHLSIALAGIAVAALSATGALAQGSHQKAQSKQSAQKPAAAPAPAPKELGTAQSWTAYSYPVTNGTVCYIVGEPAKKEPATAKRSRVNVLVTHNTAEKTTNVVSFVAGYAFADKAEVDVDIDGKKFKLFTAGDTAWARDAATDKALVEAMAKGNTAVVKGNSARGTATTDTYSLTGFTHVLNLIDKACNVKH